MGNSRNSAASAPPRFTMMTSDQPARFKCLSRRRDVRLRPARTTATSPGSGSWFTCVNVAMDETRRTRPTPRCRIAAVKDADSIPMGASNRTVMERAGSPGARVGVTWRARVNSMTESRLRRSQRATRRDFFMGTARCGDIVLHLGGGGAFSIADDRHVPRYAQVAQEPRITSGERRRSPARPSDEAEDFVARRRSRGSSRSRSWTPGRSPRRP